MIQEDALEYQADNQGNVAYRAPRVEEGGCSGRAVDRVH